MLFNSFFDTNRLTVVLMTVSIAGVVMTLVSEFRHRYWWPGWLAEARAVIAENGLPTNVHIAAHTGHRSKKGR